MMLLQILKRRGGFGPSNSINLGSGSSEHEDSVLGLREVGAGEWKSFIMELSVHSVNDA